MPLRVFLYWIMVIGLAETAAAEELPPLRVDPALIRGDAAAPAEPAAAKLATAVEPAPAAAPIRTPLLDAPSPGGALPMRQLIEPDTAPAPVRTPAPVPAAKPVALVAPARPVSPAREQASSETVPSPAPAAAKAAPAAVKVEPAVVKVEPAVVKVEPAAVKVEPVVVKVEPAVVKAEPALAPATAESAATATLQPHEPPQVRERPALQPLYSAHVAAGELPNPALKPSSALVTPSRDDDAPQPTFVSANRLYGRNDVEMVAEGDAELRRVGTVLTADRLSYWHIDDEVEAMGDVRLQRERDVFTGPRLRMKIEENVGFFEQPTYSMTRISNQSLPGAIPGIDLPVRKEITGRGEAERIEFEGEGLYHLNKATYTTCPAGNDGWHAEVGDLKLDYNREVAEGSEGKVVFQGVPILYSPWLSFSLDNQRKSGLLTPTFGSTSKSGIEVMAPWYWNIAPNMDATIAPRLMAKRGAQWNADVRYLDYKFSGESHVEYLPDDRLEHKRRFAYAIQHRHQDLGHGFSGSLNLNGVSDDTYFSDLSKPASVLTQTNLLRQGQLNYSGGWWNAALTAQRYQVLQDPSLPVADEPYRRLPQFNVNANRYDLPLGGVFNFSGEHVRFDHPTFVVGQRNTLYPQFSLPLQTSFLTVTPKLGVHATHYQLDRQAAGTPNDLSRTLPVFSLDSSLVFERDAEVFGRNVTQTVEPRLYYLYVPNKDQSQIPIFDSGLADFNFAQIFAENRYGGGDRVSDANQLTAAVTSRLLDPSTGAELLRGLIGQRYYFDTQHVTLPAVGTNPAEVPRTGRSADVLAALTGQVLPKTYVDTGWQYNPRDARTERLNVGGRYQPEIGKVLNAGYRYTRDLLGQVDISAQWPITGGWHGVGRYNYSTKERRMIESAGGLEYDGGCWVARIVVQRIATLTQQATTSLFVQLELNGFSRIGSTPLDILRRSVPGYGLINQPSSVDPAFSPY